MEDIFIFNIEKWTASKSNLLNSECIIHGSKLAWQIIRSQQGGLSQGDVQPPGWANQL